MPAQSERSHFGMTDDENASVLASQRASTRPRFPLPIHGIDVRYWEFVRGVGLLEPPVHRVPWRRCWTPAIVPAVRVETRLSVARHRVVCAPENHIKKTQSVEEEVTTPSVGTSAPNDLS